MEPRKILVATDFSDEAAVALRQALRVARRTGAELVLLHVSAPLPEEPAHVLRAQPPALQTALALQIADVRKRLDELVESTRGAGLTVTKLFTEGHPDTMIPSVAAEIGADLVVVGTHGRTGFRRLLLGSVAERVVRLSETAVMVARFVPDAPPANGFRRVLVPTDFSPPADEALATAIALAAPEGVVELFHVLQSPVMFTPQDWTGATLIEVERWRVVAREDAMSRSQALLQTLGRSGVRLTGALAEGAPTMEIQRRLEAGSYDLVVMGTHGRRGIRRGLVGSVAEATVRHAPCSVVTLRAQAPEGG
jgi:nucleotide-binding universal stress UspA family protein